MSAVHELASASALLVAGVFAVAAAAKARAPVATASTFRSLGLPVARPLARVVPGAELAVAVALVAAPRVGAVTALVLIVVFTVVLARAWRAGVDVSCGCFGSASTSPVSGVTLARNALLAVAALSAAVASRPVVPDIAAVVAVGTAAVLAALGLALADLRRVTGVLWRVEVP